jgi:hypothetical protein
MRRDQRLYRAVGVLRRIKEIELAKLGRIEAKIHGLDAEELSLRRHLETPERFGGALIKLILIRLGDTSGARNEEAERLTLQRNDLVERARRIKQLERLANEAKVELAIEQTMHEYHELADLMVIRTLVSVG